MDIDIRQTDAGHHWVRFFGELRGADGTTIEQKLHPLIAERDRAMIIDLSEMPSIDSCGLSQLISLTTHARLSQSQVILVGPTPFVAGVFRKTELDKWFDMATDVEEAGRRLAGS